VSENWLFQVSPKLADGTLINLRGSNPDEFNQVVSWATENAAKFVDVVTAINAVNKVPALAGNVTSTQVQNDAPAQAVNGWANNQQSQQAAPSWSQPATAGPACKHGPMVARGGEKNGRAWSGFFCPTPKGTPDQCPPQFGKG
jgi:hypothetical protein